MSSEALNKLLAKKVQTTVGGQTVQVPAPKEEKSFHVFYHTSPSCCMVTDKGRMIYFVNYRYVTDIAEDIEYLQREVALGHPNLSVKAGQEVMTSSQLDPMAELRAKFRAEFEEENRQKAAAIAAGQLPQMGTSDPGKLVPGSTKTTVDAAGSSSVS